MTTMPFDDQLLQCIDCGAALSAAGPDGLQCRGCARAYPVEDGILHALDALSGPNRVAADFYDSPWWERYQVRERIAFLLTGGERLFRRQFLKWFPPLGGQRLLEIGIGDGGNVPYLDPDCEIYGIDVSRTQLQKCGRRHAGRRMRLFLTEAERLPFRSHSFDHALSWGAFNLFTSRSAALKEIVRVVKPGGTIVIGDEVPGLVKLLPGHYLRMPALDRWFLHRVVAVGPGFASLLEQHKDVDIAAEARDLLPGSQIRYIWGGACYYMVAAVP
jgi:ubiquinone/menaquinone biosynthesis C-methylase UbiE